MESYQKDVASNPKVEMIHLSRDRDNAAALKWARKDKLPWPTIMRNQIAASLLTHYSNRLPTYILIDREGNKVAEGKGPVWDKIKAIE